MKTSHFNFGGLPQPTTSTEELVSKLRKRICGMSLSQALNELHRQDLVLASEAIMKELCVSSREIAIALGY